MKKLMTGVAILMATLSHAQLKEGFIAYAMTLEGLPADQAAMMGDMESKIYFKDKKSYYEMNSMMVTVKSVSDEKGTLTLMDQMGNKSYIKMTKEEIEKKTAESKDKIKDAKIEYTNDTKTIAGYECKKANVTYTTPKDGEQKTEVWYTEKVPYVQGGRRANGGDPFNGLKGMPLEYSMNQGPMKVKMMAKEISQEKVPDSKFVLSTEGYTEMKNPPGTPQGK
jgi:GLPGLI family protein